MVESREIPLTRGQVAIVDAADYESLSRFKWRAERRGVEESFYAVRKPSVHEGYGIDKRVYMHRQILGVPLVDGSHVDHINRNTLDNRRTNLRMATASQNMANRRFPANPDSGLRGVRLTPSGRWQARIRVNKKEICLGSFHAKEQAYEAYANAHREHFGEFSALA